jgi:hypothetical protein
LSYRTEIFADHWADQGLVFATEAEANQFGLDRTHLSRHPYRVVEVDEPVNYRYENGKLIPVPRLSFEESIRKMWRSVSGGTP